MDAILSAHTELKPPLWLLSPFFPSSRTSEGPLSTKMPSADVAGLLRAYMKHGRVEDAGVLAVRLLSRVTDSVPSVALPRTAAVCLSHALLEELVDRLPSSLLPLRQSLSEKLGKAQSAAARQTQVLEDIYNN